MTDTFDQMALFQFPEGKAEINSDSGYPKVDERFYEIKDRYCKRCNKCKPPSEFYSNGKGQKRPECIECCKEAERRRKSRKPKTKLAEEFKAWRDKNRGSALVAIAKSRAKRRGIPFDLDAVDIQRRIDAGKCEVSGIYFDLETPKAWNAPSLDQIIPSGGYTQDNVRVVLYAVNVMANTWGIERIIEIADSMKRYRQEGNY